MIISVVNHSNGMLKDVDVQKTIRAINRQIEADFAPYWSISATLRLEGKSTSKPQKQSPPDMRGDAVIYLWDKSDVPDALGYHDRNNAGIPYGFIFLDVVKAVGESWSVTLSHEALEAILDPEANLLVQGPHPADPSREVFHWYEASDAVQAETYQIDGIDVSNFVLPLYFTSGDETGGRNDFLNISHGGKTLRSFGVNPGGYVGFYDPKINDHDTWQPKGDKKSTARAEAKAMAAEARRAKRHEFMRTGRSATKAASAFRAAQKKKGKTR